MRKIYLYTFIVILLSLVIFASGCTSNNNQTNDTSLGSYAVNGLSFSYPIEWVVQSTTRGNINNINIYDQDFLESNGTKGDLVNIVSQPKTGNLTYDSVKNDIKNSTNISYNTSDGTINIAGMTGNYTLFNGTDSVGNQTQVKLIYFEKNNFTYILSFVAGGGVNIQDQQKFFDTIINSFQVP